MRQTARQTKQTYQAPQQQPIATTRQPNGMLRFGVGAGLVLLAGVLAFFFLPMLIVVLTGMFIYVVVPVLCLIGLWQVFTWAVYKH